MSGSEAPSFGLVVPHQNWASFKGPEKPFEAMLEEALGRQDAAAVKAVWGERSTARTASCDASALT